MSLRDRAAADARAILEDSAGGFGRTITVTAPDGTTAELTGFSNDISQVIDPETGIAVAGRLASVALPIAALVDAGLGMPRAVADSARKPWRVSFADTGGTVHTFKVREAMPDRSLGIVTCTLEAYKADP